MGPQYGEEQQEIDQNGVDIIIALDISKSMDAQDIKPSRLKEGELELKEFVNSLKGDRVGLVTFAGKSVRNSPLTMDYSAIEMFIDEISTGMIRYQGTDLQGAVLKDLNGFSDKNAKGRAFIIISDGENHNQPLDDALDLASDMNVKIYSIGAGSISGAPIPVTNRGFKRNDKGEVIISKLEGKASSKVI